MRKAWMLVVLACLLGGAPALAADDQEDDGGGAIGAWDWDAWRRSAGAGPGGGVGGDDDGFSNEAVQRAIKAGIEYLWSCQGGDGSWPPYGGHNRYPTGTTALAAYALLAAGVSPLEERMAKALDFLAETETNKTYGLGLRCQAWYLANKETGGKYMEPFKKDLKLLLTSTKQGAYNYNCNGNGQSHGDHSNSQYGVLGVWGGKLARQEIPEQYWLLVMKYWTGAQNTDGGWSYRRGSSTATMTAAGVATLFVCYDSAYADRFIQCDVSNRNDQPIVDGLKWMDENFNAALRVRQGGLMGHGDIFYFLYGVERVGLASGFKYFGDKDWYKLGATELLRMQNGNGSWRGKRDAHISTSFAILFLVRGQHAIAFNKLEWEGGDWNNRPRDLAGLTRWMSGTLERQLNWQIISAKAPVEEWHDAPILYISGAQDPNFTDEHIEKLRNFIWQGGTILSVTECRGRGFGQGIRKAYERILPGYKLAPAPTDSPLYEIHYKLYRRPTFYTITNGIRPLVIHTDQDLSKSWQMEMRRTAAGDFQGPSNVLMYVTDKGQLRPRGVSHWPSEVKVTPRKTVRVGRLKYEGNWDPEPLALERFRRLMAREQRIRVHLMDPVSLADLGRDDANTPDVAVMTGTKAFELNMMERARLAKYLETGGSLIVDAAGGSMEFADSAEAMLEAVFGRRSVRRLATDSPILKRDGCEIEQVKYRRKARVERGLREIPNIRCVQVRRRFAVIFSKEDLTAGLVGYPCYNCAGYEPESCFQIYRNAVLYARDTGRHIPLKKPADDEK